MPYEDYSLKEIAARLAIYDVYARYIHAADGRDIEAMDRVFLPGTIFDWTGAGGTRDTWAEAKQGDFLTGRMFPYVFHMCGNFAIDFNDEITAAGVKSQTIHPSGLTTAAGEPKLFQAHGGYDDKLVRTEDGWRITERIWNHAWVVGPLGYVDGIPAMFEHVQ